MKLCIPVSGVGSILEAFIAAEIKPDLVITDRPCRGEQIAISNDIELVKLHRRDFYQSGKFDRTAYTKKFEEVLQSHDINLITMAGFLTVLSPHILDSFGGHLINTHTSLFNGLSAVWPGSGEDAIKSVLEHKQPEAGATIHLATEVLDTGPVLAMCRVKVRSDDTVETLWERVKVEERKLYPATIKRVMAGEINLETKWREWLNHKNAKLGI